MTDIIKENNDKSFADLNLFSIFGLMPCEKTAIIGCGGKTSLMYALAEEMRGRPVLITTTTRISRPPAYIYDFETDSNIKALKNGVYLFFHGEKDGKLLAPDADELMRVQSLFDCVLIEADGSKLRPLKGWAEHEPVVPDFVTATIAVAAVSPAGDVVSEENTHRLPIFSRITGASKGEAVTAAHIAAMISSPQGMLQKAVGKRILFINQVESEKDLNNALKIYGSLPKAFVKSLSRVVLGSIKQNTYEIVWEGGFNDTEHS